MADETAPTDPGVPEAAPFTAPAGALIGGYAGLMFGDEANRQLEDVFGFSVTGKPIEEVEPNLRPFAVAGEATGGAIGPIGGLQSLVRQGVRLTKSFVPPSKARRLLRRV